MRNRIRMTAALVTLLGSGVLRGQSPPATATPGKIGVINIQAAIASTAEGKKALGELQAKYQPRQQELVRQQQEIQDLQERLQKQATTLSDDEQLRLRRQLDEKQKVFTRASDDFNTSVRDDRQELVSRIGQKMVKLITDYGVQNGYSLILDAQVPVVSSDQVVDGQLQIYYAAKDTNVTEELVKRYDTANPAGSESKPALTNPAPAATPPQTTPPRSTAPSKPVVKPKN